MDIGRRAEYRVAVDEATNLQVSVSTPGSSPSEGRFIDLSASGAGVRFVAPNRPELAVGQVVDLVFTSEKLRTPLTVAARVQHRAEEEEGSRRYGFRFLQPQQLDAHLPPAFREVFNRRKAIRVSPDPYEPVEVGLVPEGSEFPVAVQLQNISAFGLGVSLEADLEPTFAKTTRVGISMRLPDAREPVNLIGDIRYRRLVGARIHYGIDYDGESTEDFARQQEILGKYVVKREHQSRRKAKRQGK
ncbi:MAG: PilZ domain-containing protein [Planctomycetota bacterium]|jgi:c-di-GMP-binding flagellar brake protein YcgR